MVVSLTRNSTGGDAVEATGPLEGVSVDVSKFRHPWELVVHVLFLTPEKRAVFQVLGSDDGFRNAIPGPTFNPSGEVQSAAPRKYVAKSEDYPSLPVGKPGAQLRLTLTALDVGASVRYSGFIRAGEA